MVAQILYDNVVDDVLETLAERGTLIRNCAGTLYTYKAGAWGVISPAEMAAIDKLMYIASDEHTFPFAEKVKGLWATIKARVDEIEIEQLDAQVWIALPNGTLDPSTGDLHKHNPAHLTTRRVAIEYKPKAKCPAWLKMLAGTMVDKTPETRAAYMSFLQEFFGMAMCGFNPSTPRELRKALILYGQSGTAKTSGVADVLRQFFHPDELCADNVDQLSKDFGLARLAAARALISDDAVREKSKPDANVLKKLITGEPMTATRKYKDQQDFRFRGPVVFTTNNKPKIEDETDALFNRTVLLTFDYEFTEKDRALLNGKTPVDVLREAGEFPGIMNWALEGMERARAAGKYSSVSEAQESSKVWRSENDPTYDFLSKYGTFDPKLFCSVPMLARMISVYSQDEHHREVSPKAVANRLKRETKKLVKGVEIVRDEASGDVLHGLKLSAEGMLWARRAKDMVPEGVKWAINGKVL